MVRQLRFYCAAGAESSSARRELEALPTDAQGALAAALKRFQNDECSTGELGRIGDFCYVRVQLGTNPYRAYFFQDVDRIHFIIVHVTYKNQQKVSLKTRNLLDQRRTAWLSAGKKMRSQGSSG